MESWDASKLAWTEQITKLQNKIFEEKPSSLNEAADPSVTCPSLFYFSHQCSQLTQSEMELLLHVLGPMGSSSQPSTSI